MVFDEKNPNIPARSCFLSNTANIRATSYTINLKRLHEELLQILWKIGIFLILNFIEQVINNSCALRMYNFMHTFIHSWQIVRRHIQEFLKEFFDNS